jgi:gluconokinase
MVVIVMGVSGVGKTTVGKLLASALGAGFVEGDAYHPPENVEKMRRGIPLDDADREPWLERLAREIGMWLEEGRTVVLACSALRQRYRDMLMAGRPDVYFVHLQGSEELIRARLAERRGHYMPPSLLSSQLATLETPRDAIVAEVTGTPEEIAAGVQAELQRPCPSPAHRGRGRGSRPRSPGGPRCGRLRTARGGAGSARS